MIAIPQRLTEETLPEAVERLKVEIADQLQSEADSDSPRRPRYNRADREALAYVNADPDYTTALEALATSSPGPDRDRKRQRMREAMDAAFVRFEREHPKELSAPNGDWVFENRESAGSRPACEPAPVKTKARPAKPAHVPQRSVGDLVSRDWLMAGNAVVTVRTPSGKQFTFRVTHKPRTAEHRQTWFVRLLNSPAGSSNTYLGVLDDFQGQIMATGSSALMESSFPVRLLNHLLARIWTGDHDAYRIKGFSVRRGTR